MSMGLRIMHVGHDGEHWHANGYVIVETDDGCDIYREDRYENSKEGEPEETTYSFKQALYWCYQN